MFDAEHWGSWLELQVPDARYFADSRIELIPASAWRDDVAVSEAQPGWGAILDRWQVDALVLSSGDQPSLVAAIGNSAAWRVIHRDAEGWSRSGREPPPHLIPCGSRAVDRGADRPV